MSLLIESIKLKDGRLCNLEYHQGRMNRSMTELFPDVRPVDLRSHVSVPENCRQGLFKIRVLYGATVEKIEIEPYFPRVIRSLKVVRHESIDYRLKYTNRQILQELFARRENCDDIIIVKNGLVTDSFAANLVFFDGKKWVTPSAPLLKGTQRQFLLDRSIVTEQEITEDDICRFHKMGLVNAMVDFEEMPVIPIDQVCF